VSREQELQRRLDLVTDSLGRAINTLEGPAAQRLLGGAGRSVIDYLTLIQKIANGDRVAIDADNVVPIGHSVKVGAQLKGDAHG